MAERGKRGQAKPQTGAPVGAGPKTPRYLGSQLLIATPNMGDPRFEKSVILLGAHDEEHAMGVVVNKTLSDVDFIDVLDSIDLDTSAAFDDVAVHYGGPVQTDRGLVVHSLDYRTSTTLEISAEIGITGSREILEAILGERRSAPPEKWFLALGYAGWGEGQLESEIASNAWAHCPATSDIVFADDHETKWSLALESIGVSPAMLTPDWFGGGRRGAELSVLRASKQRLRARKCDKTNSWSASTCNLIATRSRAATAARSLLCARRLFTCCVVRIRRTINHGALGSRLTRPYAIVENAVACAF